MKPLRALLLCALCLDLAVPLAAQGAQGLEDPVMAARAQRAAAQGISEADLPPVPRGIVEPPPLPAPEIHPRDTRGYRASRRARRARKGTVKKGRATSRVRKASPPKAGKPAPRKPRS